VEIDSTRLERQRETGVTPESEPCSIQGRTTIPGWTAMPRGLGEPFTPPVPAGSDVSDTDTEDSAEPRSGHKELSPQSTIPNADDYGIERPLREMSGRSGPISRSPHKQVRKSRRCLRELASLWPGGLDE
jgi:hypothetical protein